MRGVARASSQHLFWFFLNKKKKTYSNPTLISIGIQSVTVAQMRKDEKDQELIRKL